MLRFIFITALYFTFGLFAQDAPISENNDSQAYFLVELEDADDDSKIKALELISDKDAISKMVYDKSKKVRIAAIGYLQDEEILHSLAFDKDDDIRLAAAKKITHKGILAILIKDKSEDIRIAAINNGVYPHLLLKCLKDPSEKIRIAAYSHIEDQRILEKALKSTSESEKVAILKNIKNQRIVTRYLRDTSKNIRSAAFESLTSDVYLKWLVKVKHKEFGVKALLKIKDQEYLTKFLLKNANQWEPKPGPVHRSQKLNSAQIFLLMPVIPILTLGDAFTTLQNPNKQPRIIHQVLAKIDDVKYLKILAECENGGLRDLTYKHLKDSKDPKHKLLFERLFK